jgi:hypothetical protein
MGFDKVLGKFLSTWRLLELLQQLKEANGGISRNGGSSCKGGTYF